MRPFLASVLVILFLGTSAPAQISLPETLTLRRGRLARVEAKCDTEVRWLNLHEELDLIPDSSGKWAFLQSSTPGRYKIAAYTATKEGKPSEPAYCVVIVEGEAPPVKPPPMPVPPAPKVEASIVRLQFGSSGCTATIVGPRRADGRWDVLTAAHCTGAVKSVGKITLLDGRKFPVTVQVRNPICDITWMIAETTDADLPYAMLASANPAPGTAIWHKGYGVDKPGNKEEGTVVSEQDSNGQLKMNLSVSSGDSGSGIFRVDTNELIAVVCCTASMARKGSMWGGSTLRANQLRPVQQTFEETPDEWTPLPIPSREDPVRFMPFAWVQ